MKTVKDLRQYVEDTYPQLAKTKFDFIKSGHTIYIYVVDRNGDLQKAVIFQGSLPAADELPILRKYVQDRIKKNLQRWEYC